MDSVKFEALVKSGRVQVFGEIGTYYGGAKGKAAAGEIGVSAPGGRREICRMPLNYRVPWAVIHLIKHPCNG